MGALGIGLSLFSNFYIREPGVREKFNIKEKKQNIMKSFAKRRGEKVAPKADDEDTRSWLQKLKGSAWDVMLSPTTKNVTIASMFRKFGDMAITCFIPIFILKSYPSFKSQYAVMSAAILAILGFTSNIAGGIVSDKFEKKSLMTKSLICVISGLLSCPAIALVTGGHGNFYLCMAGLAAYIFVSGSYNSSAITMMQNSVPSDQTGKIIGAYNLYTNLAQTLSPIVFGFLATSLGAKSNPQVYGKLITLFITVGYSISSLFFWRAGGHYKAHMLKEQQAEREIEE